MGLSQNFTIIFIFYVQLVLKFIATKHLRFEYIYRIPYKSSHMFATQNPHIQYAFHSIAINMECYKHSVERTYDHTMVVLALTILRHEVCTFRGLTAQSAICIPAGRPWSRRVLFMRALFFTQPIFGLLFHFCMRWFFRFKYQIRNGKCDETFELIYDTFLLWKTPRIYVP